MIKVLAFGQIAEVTGKQFTVNASSIESLQNELKERYPKLATLKYAIAVNKKMVAGNADLSENDEVALMPPYSGG